MTSFPLCADLHSDEQVRPAQQLHNQLRCMFNTTVQPPQALHWSWGWSAGPQTLSALLPCHTPCCSPAVALQPHAAGPMCLAAELFYIPVCPCPKQITKYVNIHLETSISSDCNVCRNSNIICSGRISYNSANNSNNRSSNSSSSFNHNIND